MVMKKDQLDNLKKTRLQVFIRTTLVTILSLAVIVGIGYSLDLLLESKPTITIISLVAGYPLTQIIVYKITKKKL
jgi:F0F1-type ATP synthase assembly protein I